MATQRGRAKPKPKNGMDFSYPVPPVIPVVVSKRRIGEEIMGWVACCVLIALLLPLLGMLYFDILEAKHEVKQEVQKVEKLVNKTKENK